MGLNWVLCEAISEMIGSAVLCRVNGLNLMDKIKLAHMSVCWLCILLVALYCTSHISLPL